jgi:hypothetical protein
LKTTAIQVNWGQIWQVGRVGTLGFWVGAVLVNFGFGVVDREE